MYTQAKRSAVDLHIRVLRLSRELSGFGFQYYQTVRGETFD